jgi:hypothetical protein
VGSLSIRVCVSLGINNCVILIVNLPHLLQLSKSLSVWRKCHAIADLSVRRYRCTNASPGHGRNSHWHNAKMSSLLTCVRICAVGLYILYLL